MEKNQNQVIATLSEKEQKDVMGGILPPPKDESKSLIEQLFDELKDGWVCH